MKIEKKHVIAGVLAVVSIALAVAYIQYKRLMDYSFTYNKIKVRSLSAKLFNFDLFLNFLNKSAITFDIVEQEYKAYVNGEFVSTIVNYKPVKILPKATSVLGFNVQFDPNKVLKTLKKNYAQILLDPKSVNIKVDIKLKVLFYGFKLSIPYTYEETLKGLIDIYKAPAEDGKNENPKT